MRRAESVQDRRHSQRLKAALRYLKPYSLYFETYDGIAEVGSGSVEHLAAGASVTRYLSYIIDKYDIYSGQTETTLYCEASARHPEGHRITAERFPLLIHVAADQVAMKLTVEQTSPAQQFYKAGDKVTFAWSLQNESGKDLTLDLITVESPSDESSHETIRKGPATLPAHGAPLTGTYTLTLKQSWLSDDFNFHGGYLNYGRWCLSVQACASQSGKPPASVLSNTVTIRLNSKSANSDLVLEVEQLSPEKPFYAVDEEVTFGWKVTNVGPVDVTLYSIECAAPDDQAQPVELSPVTLPAHGGSSVVGTHTVTLYEDWMQTRGKQEGTWSFYYVAQADFADSDLGSVRSNEVEFELAPKEYARTLQLTVNQVSAVKDAYAADENVSFRWTLKNTGEEDLTVDSVTMNWGDGAALTISDKPLSLPAGESVTDTWTAKLDPALTIEDAWHLFFTGAARQTNDGTPWYSNEVYLTLERDFK